LRGLRPYSVVTIAPISRNRPFLERPMAPRVQRTPRTGDEKTDIWSPDCRYLTQITDRKVCYLGARFLAALKRKLSNIWPDSCWNYLIKHCVPWGLARYERQTSQIRETLYPDCWTCTWSIRHDQQPGDIRLIILRPPMHRWS